ncbi:MAG: hypothetical protein IJH67_11780 [Thermoguttaceae bacterium]|nr:hypothetical protein [Thermoguttaceae bacterium]
MKRTLFWILLIAACCNAAVALAQTKRERLEGLVYEVEDWTEPKDAMKLNQPGASNWQIWTKEIDVIHKRSNSASVTTPVLPTDADREKPEDGAPVLHTKITGIPAGRYRVFMNGTNRPLALSFDGGKTWEKSSLYGENDFGIYDISDGVFELWVDDRYASENKGWAYYDYIRFVPTTEEVTIDNLQRYYIDSASPFNPDFGKDLPDDYIQISWTTNVPTPPAEVTFIPWEWDENTKPKTIVESDSGLRNHAVVCPWGNYEKAIVTLPINRSGKAISKTVSFLSQVSEENKTDKTVVELFVSEPTGFARQNWPVTSGVPLAKGACYADSDQTFRLKNADGKNIRAQFTPVAWWQDGSVQWLVVDFRADTDAQKPVKYTLEILPEMLSEEILDEDEDDKEVNKRFDGISAEHLCPFESEIILADGRKLYAPGDGYSQDYRLKDVRVTTRLEGNYIEAEKMDQARDIFWESARDADDDSDQPQRSQPLQPGFVWRIEITDYLNEMPHNDLRRTRWTIGNNQLDKPFTLIRSASVRNDLFVYGGEYSCQILQDELNHASVEINGKKQETDRFDGYLELHNGAVLFRNFWQTWPKGLSVKMTPAPKPGGGGVFNITDSLEDKPESHNGNSEGKPFYLNLEYQILPPLPDGYSDDPKKNKRDNLVQNYFWLKDNCYQFKRGMEITVEFWTASRERMENDKHLREHLQNPLFAACSPEYYCSVGVFPPVSPATKGEFDGYEQAFRTSFENLEKGRRERGEYGWMSFGDWFGERVNNWGNNEYDLSYTCAMHFARTGDVTILQRGIEMAQHYMTVDFQKYPVNPNAKERMYLHTFGHVNGFFTPDDPRLEGLTGQATQVPYWFKAETDNGGGHDFQPGNFYIGVLTGDEELLSKAYTVCYAQAKWYTPRFSFGIERGAGWPLTNAVYAYRFTNNPFFLNAARIYFETIQSKQNPETGCFDLPQDQTECDCPDKKEHRGGKAFAVGVLLHGLARYYETEPDPARKEQIKTVIVRCADWLLDCSWNEEKQGFRYKTGCPKYADSGWYSILVAEGLAYASEISGNPRYRDFLVRTLGKPIQNVSGTGKASGKDFSQKHRQTPHALYWLKKHGVTNLE